MHLATALFRYLLLDLLEWLLDLLEPREDGGLALSWGLQGRVGGHLLWGGAQVTLDRVQGLLQLLLDLTCDLAASPDTVDHV